MQNKLITLLAKNASYPLKLAHEIGIDLAIAVVEIINISEVGFLNSREQVAQRLKQLAVRRPYQVIDDLVTLGVVCVAEDQLILNLDFFQETDDLQVEIKPSIWQDKEFLSLLARWKAILTAKAIRRSEKELNLMFEGKDPESAKRALQYSIDNRLSTLFYRENNRGHAKADSSYRGGRINRGAGEGAFAKSEGSSKEVRAVHKGIESLE